MKLRTSNLARLNFTLKQSSLTTLGMSRQHAKKDAGKRDGTRQSNRRNDSPTVALSKQLSWLLRHGLDKSGLEVRNDGYVRLDELVQAFTAPN